MEVLLEVAVVELEVVAVEVFFRRCSGRIYNISSGMICRIRSGSSGSILEVAMVELEVVAVEIFLGVAVVEFIM